MTKCVIYVRVSSEDQVKGISLESQEAACRDNAKRQGWEVAQVFTERGVSAKTANRPEFIRMVKQAAQAHRGITRCIVYSVSRFARKVIDHLQFRRELKAAGIILASVTETFDDSPQGEAMEQMMAVMAQLDNGQRAATTVRVMSYLQAQGYWLHQAPLGYKTARRENRPILVEDPETGPLVRAAFEAVAAGRLLPIGVRDYLTGLGLRGARGRGLTLWSVHRMLQNPVYAGWIETTWTNGATIKAAFDGLVSEEVFDRVQLILGGRVKTAAPRSATDHDFPLRSFLACATCGTPMTGSYSTGRGGRYPYYECRVRCDCQRIKKADMESAFIALLDSITLKNERLLAAFREMVMGKLTARRAELLIDQERLKGQIKRVQQKLDRLLDAMLDGTITREDHKTKATQLRLDLASARTAMTELDLEDVDIEGAMDMAGALLSNLSAYWLRLNTTKRVRFQSLLFPDGLAWSHSEGLRTVGSGCIFDALLRKQFEEISLASPTRFELVLPG